MYVKYIQYVPIIVSIVIIMLFVWQLLKLQRLDDIKEIISLKQIKQYILPNIHKICQIQLSVLVICCLCNYAINTNKAQIVVEFTYTELQQGLNPNGTRFNPSSMTQDDVMTLVSHDLGVDIQPAELRRCIKIHNTGSQQELTATSIPKLTSGYKIQTTDEIYKYSFTAQELLDSFQKCYSDYFVKTYAGNFSILSLNGIDDVLNLDYLEMIDYFQMYQANIQHLINKFKNENNTYKYNGVSFADIQESLGSFESITIERFKQFVLDNGISKDDQAYSSWVLYQNKIKDVQMRKYRAGYDIRLDAIKLYDEKMATVVLVPTRDSKDEFYMSRTQIGVDYLAEEANSYQNKATDIQNQINTNNYAINMVTNQQADESYYIEADKMQEDIVNQLKSIGESALELTEEYIKYKRDGYLKVETNEQQFLSLIDLKKGIMLTGLCGLTVQLYFILKRYRVYNLK